MLLLNIILITRMSDGKEIRIINCIGLLKIFHARLFMLQAISKLDFTYAVPRLRLDGLIVRLAAFIIIVIKVATRTGRKRHFHLPLCPYFSLACQTAQLSSSLSWIPYMTYVMLFTLCTSSTYYSVGHSLLYFLIPPPSLSGHHLRKPLSELLRCCCSSY